MDNNTIFDHVVKGFVQAGAYSCCIPASIVLYEALKKKGKKGLSLKTGCYLIPSAKCGFHMWVQVYDQVYDIGYAILKQQISEFPYCKVSLTIPSGYRRNAVDTLQERKTLQQNLNLAKMYHKRPIQFWSNAPDQLKQLRRDIIDLVDGH